LGANQLILSVSQESSGRNNAAAGLLVEFVEAGVAAMQDQRPSAASGEAKSKSREPKGDAAERGREPASKSAPPEAESGRKKGGVLAWIRDHKLVTFLIAIGLMAAVAAGVAWWRNAQKYAETDDAFIDARPSAISAEVAAAVTDVPVTDNEIIKPGQVLARLDDRNYVAAVAQAKAQIAQAEASISSAEASTTAQNATVNSVSEQVREAQAALVYSKEQYQRAENLLKTGAGTLQQAQQTKSDLIQKQAALDAAQALLAQAKRRLAVYAAQRQDGEAQRKVAEAQLTLADANLSRTTIFAPFEGRVTQLTAAKGDYATPGQTLMYIVPLHVWVTANFRETELSDMRPGDPATLCIDAYGKCFPGRVQSIQAGSGTAFSLLPAENATGNYVKVVQRVPVKLVFDKQPDLELGPGMSVTPSVKVR
jgi:membrane fusion protein, multidrug efflux system